MQSPYKPLARINKAWLADRTRVVKDRQPGAFASIINVVPNLSDGIGRVRTGYEIYDDSHGGITKVSGTQNFKVAPIQNPEDRDVHFFLKTPGGVSSVDMRPHYIDNGTIGTSRQDEAVTLARSIVATGATWSAGGTDNIITMTSVERAAAGLNTTNDYYNGWMVFNQSDNSYAIIKDYAVAAGAATITFVENVVNTGLAWGTTGNLVFYANFHEDPYDATYKTGGFFPRWNEDKANPPVMNAENSIIRFSGGQGNSLFLKGIHITPRLTRTFFPGISTTGPTIDRSLSFRKTYIAERDCKRPVDVNDVLQSTEVGGYTGGGTTEEISPIADLGGNHFRGFRSGVGGYMVDLYADVNEASGAPDDTDYVYPINSGTLNTVLLKLGAPSAPLEVGGSLTVNVRYFLATTGSATLNAILRNSDGSSLGTGSTSVPTSPSYGTITFSITVPDGIDTTGWYIEINTPGWTGVTDLRVTNIYVTAPVLTVAEADLLTTGRTYFLAYAPVYDGFQIGRLQPLESTGYYTAVSGDWTNNYLGTGPGILKINFGISLAKLNKRITGFRIYATYNDGIDQTPNLPYRYMKQFNFTSADDPYATDWVFDVTTGTFQLSVSILQTDFDRVGNTFQTDSGYDHKTLSMMYSYSHELILSGRRFIANVWDNYNIVGTDRDNLFTNPVGGADDLNSGAVQPDIFPDMEGVYRLRVDPTVGTQVNGLAPIGPDEFLIMKDRGLIRARLLLIGSKPDLAQTVESRDVGLATVGEYTTDEEGVIFFVGYDDVHAYDRGVVKPTIERADYNDWLDTFRAIKQSKKESATIVYLPEMKSILVCLDNELQGTDFTGMQYLYHRGLWTKVNFGEITYNGVPKVSMRWKTQLSNGHIICTSTEGVNAPELYRLSWEYVSAGVYALTFNDWYNAQEYGIVPYFDSGYLLGHPEGDDTLIRKVVVNRTLDKNGSVVTPTGTLDVDVMNENTGSGNAFEKNSISATETRVTLRPRRGSKRRAQSWRLVYNTATSGKERLSTGEVYHINSIELYGEVVPRVRSDGE